MSDTTTDEPGDARSLYRLPPEEFTAARDLLARRLRSAGERDKAAEVKKLRRPNAPAWALNQVAQGSPGLIEDVLAAGAELREAMEIGDGRLLRDAERSTRQATDSVVAQAERLLDGAGHPATDDVRARLAGTVRAAIVDADVASQLRAGTLERDVELPGFGLDMPVAASPRPAAPAPAPAPLRRKPARDDQDREERRRQREHEEREKRARAEEARRRDEARRAVRKRLAELESEAGRLARQAERLATVADRAEEEARRARTDADAAASAAEEAALEVSEARRRLDQLAAE